MCANRGADGGKSKWVKLCASRESPKLAMSTSKGEKTKPTRVMPTVSKVKPKHAESRTEDGGSRWVKSHTKGALPGRAKLLSKNSTTPREKV